MLMYADDTEDHLFIYVILTHSWLKLWFDDPTISKKDRNSIFFC